MAAADEGEDDDEGGAPPGLPKDAPFVMSPGGHAAIAEEARRLWQEERPRVVEVVSWAASLGDRSENADYQYGKRRLREIDRRLRFLRRRLDRAQVVDPAQPARRDRVFFGATVGYAREDGAEAAVGVLLRHRPEAVGADAQPDARPVRHRPGTDPVLPFPLARDRSPGAGG